MILEEIEENFTYYKNIYHDILPNLEKTNSQAKILLENSLYLSAFTIFEDFLKVLIDNYIDNKIKKKTTYLDLSEEIGRNIFLKQQKRIDRIFNNNDSESKEAFKAYFKILKEPLSKEILSEHIHFEFLHKNKLNGYYKILFNELLGKPNFLNDLKILIRKNEVSEVKHEVSTDAFTFLTDYTENIRNNIAHKNSIFKIEEEHLNFNVIIDSFYEIISKIKVQYEEHNNFELTRCVQDNILDSFN